jgi:hypothetical protein
LDKLDAARVHHLQLLGKPFSSSELAEALDQAFASGEFGQRDANRTTPVRDRAPATEPDLGNKESLASAGLFLAARSPMRQALG